MYSTKTYKGVDLSHWNKVTDWSKMEQDFIIQKCTQGTNYLDPTYNERKDKIQGSYHFANGTDPIKEADWYLKNVGVSSTANMLVLDWEIEHADPVGWCKKFINHIKEKTGKECWLYTNDARALKYSWPEDWKFWIARYKDYSGDLDWDYQPRHKWDMWQYTSRGKVDGIEGGVDRNVSKVKLNATSPQEEENNENGTDAQPTPENPTTWQTEGNNDIPHSSLEMFGELIFKYLKKAYEKVSSFFKK